MLHSIAEWNVFKEGGVVEKDRFNCMNVVENTTYGIFTKLTE